MIVLSKEKLFLADPYNEVHIKAISSFEKENHINQKTSNELKRIKTKFLKRQYLKNKKISNEISLALFIAEKGVIKDGCHIQCERGIKNCKITFLPPTSPLRKKMILSATNYALETLKMKIVFLDVNQRDKLIVSYLEKNGYENLGEEKDKILFLKEKVEVQ